MLAVLITADLGWIQSDLEELHSSSSYQFPGAKAFCANMSTSMESMSFDYLLCVQASDRVYD